MSDTHEGAAVIGTTPAAADDDDSVYVGFDTEYERQDDINFILSAQIWGAFKDRTWQAIKFLNNQRLTFQQLIAWALEEGISAGALERRPAKVFLCAHYSIADLAGLADRGEVFRQLDYCKKTFVTFTKPVEVSYYDRNRNAHEVKVFLRDPWLMCPAGNRKLETLGKYVGIEKVNISPYRIEEMSRLLAENPDLFTRYAIGDAEIAAVYTHKMAAFAKGLFGTSEPPPTVGSCAVKLAFQSWNEHDISRHDVLGTHKVPRSGGKGHYDILPLPIRQDYANFAKHAFAGGRNETYWFGPSAEAQWLDLDLAGAYSSALAAFGMPKWRWMKFENRVSKFTPDVIGFGRVTFKFPENTRFPCLPVRTATALVFPLAGECCATAPEIFLAAQMGADLKISRGCVMPMDLSCRPFVAISRAVAEARQDYKTKYGAGSLMEQLVKTIGNCVFGKLAQAIRPKRVFSTRLLDMEEMKPSQLTNEYLAAHVTGLIRAVLGEILAAVPSECTVVSATTDGFLSDVPEESIAMLATGPLCQVFSEARSKVADDAGVLVVKHRATQVMSWRTRGVATLDHDPEEEFILARAGIRTPEGSVEEQNEYIVTKFIGRTYGETFPTYRLRNARDLCFDGGDFVKEELVVQHRMDYDFKRLPIGTPSEREVNGQPHVCFPTAPLRDVQQFERLRERWTEFYNHSKRPLKRASDLHDFREYLGVVRSGKLQVPTHGAAVYVARKMFLVAYTHSRWGLRCELSNAALAKVLSGGGFSTTVREVENAKRAETPLYEHCVEATGEVQAFLFFVQGRFPTFDAGCLLSRGDDADCETGNSGNRNTGDRETSDRDTSATAAAR